jgi:hypothetical protein
MPGFRLLLLVEVSVSTQTQKSFSEKEAWVQKNRWSLVDREPWVKFGSSPSPMSNAMAVPVFGRHCG